MKRYVKVTRVVRSSKYFEVEENCEDAEQDAIDQACREDVIEEGVNGWTEDLEWLAEADE